MKDWRPSASLDRLKRRAQLLAQTRAFFAERQVMEVDVPVLGLTGVTDLHIELIRAMVGGGRRYLQSSPEYYLKRLLAAGSGPVYYLGKAFRDDERGRRHNPEFTLLEWYRPGWNELELMDEVVGLMTRLMPAATAIRRCTYREAFQRALALDPHTASLELLQLRAAEVAADASGSWSHASRSNCLDLLFSLKVEPELGPGVVQVHDFPACQAALARLDKDGQGVIVARRFEVFVNGMELANGYFELTDPVEQRSRFVEDLRQRDVAGKAPVAVDERLLAALAHGLPACAGVALGIDRLLMQLLGADSIAEVISFVD